MSPEEWDVYWAFRLAFVEHPDARISIRSNEIGGLNVWADVVLGVPLRIPRDENPNGHVVPFTGNHETNHVAYLHRPDEQLHLHVRSYFSNRHFGNRQRSWLLNLADRQAEQAVEAIEGGLKRVEESIIFVGSRPHRTLSPRAVVATVA